MKKILIVDDQEEVIELVKITLKSDNYILLDARRGEEAVNITMKEKPDLILMDIIMPGIDGLEVTRRIKSNPETKDIVIIMLTAKGQKVDYKKGYEMGADGYIVKPFRHLELISEVKEVLEQ